MINKTAETEAPWDMMKMTSGKHLAKTAIGQSQNACQ